MDVNEIRNLIKKAKNSDSAAFGRLYSEYALSLYRYALYTLKNPHDAEDAVQNACIAAYRKIGTLRKEDSFRAWFFTILINECRKIAGNSKRTCEIPCEDISFYEDTVPDTAYSTDIMSLIDTLSPTEQSIVILSVLEGYTSEEIADIVGMKPGSVRSSLSRLLKKLRAQIEGADNE